MNEKDIFEQEEYWIAQNENPSYESLYNLAIFYYHAFQQFPKAKKFIDKVYLYDVLHSSDVKWIKAKIDFEVAETEDEKISAYQAEQNILNESPEKQNNYPMNITPIEIWHNEYLKNR